ncbi:MAG: serine hydrolase domain-containing protein [Syntrophomonadaceae bacterium]
MHLVPAVLLTLVSASASPPAAPDLKTRVDAIFREYDRSDSPGCALAVYRDGRIEYARGYGMANLELGVANSPETVFDIGSTSKQFTAFSIHLLAREGKLSLDDDIRRWIPEVPSYGKTVTIRHLLHHTGGLRDYIELMELQGIRTEDLTTEADSLAVLARQKAPNFAPGEEYLYSNSGYFLLGVIVKRASGQSLRDFAEARIFGPLGMRHTQFNDAHDRLVANRATGYRKATSGGFRIDMGDWEQVGDGAVQTTVEDLQLWDQNFYEPRVGDARLLDAMQTVGVLNSGKKLVYASALVLQDYRGLPTVSHGGAWVGYRAQLLRFPQQKFSVACLCNVGGANPTRLTRDVAEVYLGDRMKPAEPAKGSGAPAAKVPAGRLQRLAGAYLERDSGEVIRLSVESGRLVGDRGSRKFSMIPVAADRFRVEGLPDVEAAALAATKTGAGGRPAITVSGLEADETETWQPIVVWTPKASDIAALAGRYESEELDTTWRLVAEDGKLFVRHRGFPEEPLSPTVEGDFSLEGVTLHFLRGPGGAVTGFTVDDGRVRGIAFRRLSSR